MQFCYKSLVLAFFVIAIPSTLPAQDFQIQANSGYSLSGVPGERIDFHNQIVNTSGQDYTIRAIKIEQQLPANWTGSMCDSTLCYPPFVDSLDFYVPAFDSVMLDLYFQTDSVLQEGYITLRLRDVNNTSDFVDYLFAASTLPTSIDHQNTVVAERIKLLQNFPNPFNPVTKIEFEIGGTTPAVVGLNVYNVLGQKVATLANGTVPAGRHEVIWDGKNDQGQAMSSGLYFYVLSSRNQKSTRKMMLIR